MDSLYLVTPSPKTQEQNFHAFIKCCVGGKYYFAPNGFYEDDLFPEMIIANGNEIWNADTDSPVIYAHIHSEEGIFERNEFYPIIENSVEYYTIFSFRCRNHLYLLDFLIRYIQQHPDCSVANVKLNLQHLNHLVKHKNDQNINWAYEGEVKPPRTDWQ